MRSLIRDAARMCAGILSFSSLSLSLSLAVPVVAAGGCGTNDAGHDEHQHQHGDAEPDAAPSGAIVAAITFGATLQAGVDLPTHFRYTRGDDGTAVSDLVVAHEKRLHLFVVGDDLSTFAHVHPEPAASPGEFDLSLSFPAPGGYHIYSDVTSTSLGQVVTVTPVTVPGAAPSPVPLVADATLVKDLDGLRVSLSPDPARLVAGEMAMLTYSVSDAASGEPITDLEPYLGAMGHLFILNQDLGQPAHAHPMEGSLMFHTVLPRAGLTKLWLQIQRAGVVYTIPFVVDVAAGS